MRFEVLFPRGRGRVSFVLALVAGFITSTSALGQTFTWNQPTSGGNWLTGSNWLPGGGPPNAAGSVALFGNAITGANSVTLSAGVTVGELRFADVDTQSSSAVYTIGASAQTITFNNGGSDNLITVAGITFANQTVATGISVAGGQPLTINNNGAPGLTTLTLSGALSSLTTGTPLNVSGASNAAISGAIGGSFGTLTKSGPGVLTLSSTSNAYTGGTVINGGVVGVAADANLGAAGGGVTLNAGTLQLTAANFGSARSISLGAGGGTILVSSGTPPTTPTLSGVISGAGSLTVDGGAYLTLLNANTFTGATVVRNAGLTLSSPLSGPAGALANTSSITVNGYVGGQIGILSLDNTTIASNNRVNDTAPVTLNGGLISIVPGTLASAAETFGTLTVQGFGTLYGNQIPTFGGAASMAFGTLTRSDAFSTLYVGGPVFGPGAGTSVQITFSGFTTLGGSGQTIQIVPWIGGDRGGVSSGSPTGTPTGFAETLYTYTVNGLIALDSRTTTNFVQVTTGGMTANRNIALTGNPAAVNSTLSILSLVINANSTVSSTLSGSGTLTVATGAMALVQPLIFDGPTLNFGANTGYLYLGNEMTIADAVVGAVGTSRIAGTAGVVVSSNADDSRNTLYLINKTNPNAFTGGLYLNGNARVAFDASDAQLGAAGGVIAFRGGTLRYLGSGPVTLATSGTNRPLQLTAAGGGAIGVEDPAGTLTVPGLISGTEQLTKIGPGTLVLSNPSNTYQGGTTFNEGTLTLGGAGSLGTGDLAIGLSGLAGATLRFNFAGTYAGNINHATSATIDTNTNAVTLSGIVSGTGATLTKAGGGTLTLSAANSYTGNTVVSAGTLMVSNATGSGTGYGSVAVSSGSGLGGTGTVGGPVTVTGGNLIVGPGGSPGRLSLRGTTTLNGSSTVQSVLAGSVAGTGYSQLVILSGGSINLGGATLNATLSYTPANSDKLFLIDNQNPTAGLIGTFNGLANGQTFTFPNGTTAQISYFGDVGSNSFTGGNDVVLANFVPVPEPAGMPIIVAGLAGLARLRRRESIGAHGERASP